MRSFKTKKLLSIILAVAMLITMMPLTGLAADDNPLFSDVKGNEYYAGAAEILAKLDILKGYPDGTFGANISITRSEMAAIVLRSQGLEKETTKAQGKTPYDDVSADHWASGYINKATELKIIQGDGNGKFRPDENVLFEEAVKIVVCSVGFGDAAIAAGGWADGYIKVAQENGILKDVPGSKGNPSVRGAVALMALQGLLTQVKTPVASVSAGNYRSAQSVTLTTETKDAKIYYTLDGKTPTTKSAEYTKAININNSATLNAIAVKNGLLNSGILSVAYTITKSSGGGGGGGSRPATPTPTPTPTPDAESLPDYIIENLGLDKTKDDNDGDGLKDFFEFSYLSTDLLLIDTDGNGITDADEDFDGDGLTNIQEQELGTLPNMVDTDDDGLTDYDEIKVHETNPLSRDTDEDGLTDDEELKLGLNPNNASTDGITPDSERIFSQTTDETVKDDALRSSDNWLSLSISGDVSGDILRNIALEESSINAFDDNRAVLSDVVDLSTSYETPLTLSFSYEQDYTGDSESLSIVSFGEDGLEIIDTIVDETNNHISGEIDGSGTYFVIDLDEFLRGLGIDVFASISDEKSMKSHYGFGSQNTEGTPADTDYDYLYDNEGNIIDQKAKTNAGASFSTFIAPPVFDFNLFSASTGATGKADVVFVIDTTGSMRSAITGVKNNVNAFAEKLVNEYNVDANFSLVEYRDITSDGINSTKQHKNVSSNWFTNVNAFKNVVNTLTVEGGGDDPETPIDGLEMARRLDWRGDATKFVVLVTDAYYKTNNNYGISDMEEMMNLFVNDDIIVSAIAYLKSYYSLLTDNTDGLYGYIYGDFSDILLGLADKVGEVTNTGGEWVFLNDFQAVKLSDTLANAAINDTDKDGLFDAQELGSSAELDMMKYITSLTNRHSIPADYYTGKTKLTVWNYLSNPTLLDTDYDGISDGNKDYDGSDVSPDIRPKKAANAKNKNTSKDGNAFSGKLSANDFTFDVNFGVDYSLFFDSNKNYKDELAVLGAIYSTIAYHTELNITDGTSLSGSIKKVFGRFGLKGVEGYKLADHFNDDDISEMTIGHREVTYKNSTKDIIVVAVRGTDATIEEWSSNFDVGANTSDYWDKNNSYWRDKDNHKGFDVAANRLYDEIIRYAGNLNPSTPKTIYIVGHSRGAAIANILGAKFEDNNIFQSFTYTFATPMTTTDKGSYSSIFNIVNKDDLVPYLPLSAWGFDKYGKTYEVSIKSQYENKWGKAQEGTWESVFVGVDYNYNGNKGDTIKKFGDVAKSRSELYKFTDDSKTFYTYDTKYNTEDEAINAANVQKDKYGDRISKYCEFYVKESDPLFGKTTYQASVKQMPAAFMMILTDVVASKCHSKDSGKDEIKGYSTRGKGEDKWLGNEIGFYVAKKYSSAKSSFVWSGADSSSDVAAWLRVGGMVHSHMPGSYYFLACDYKNLIPTK